MATLQTLRNKAGVFLAVIIGLSLLAFILGDFINSGSGMFQARRNRVGEINGKSVSYQSFQGRFETAIENYKQSSGRSDIDEQTYASIREQVWNSFMNDFVYSEEYNKLGIGCSSDELFDMVYGRNIHPQIQQIPAFQNKQTGQFDRNLVMQYLKSMEKEPSGRQKQAWLSYEQELVKDRISTKYQTAVAKGIYITRKMADAEYVESNRLFNLNFVPVRYATTPDSTIKVTQAEVEKYYNDHKDKFQQDATRDLAYVAWEIVPSQEDKDLVANWINEQKPEFERIENAGQFVNATGESRFDETYHNPASLSDPIKGWAAAAEVGNVYGPYLDNLTWKLARVTDVKNLPDSVKASHILIRPVGNNDYDAAQKTADSIKGLIERGQDFATLAAKYGTDGTKEKGGDLGWFTQEKMIPEFSKACFMAKTGDLITVRTNYGVHVVKVTEQSTPTKQVQLAILDRTITASDKTQQEIYNIASRFASTYNTGEKFEAGIVKENLNKRLANNLTEQETNITGLDNPRELIRWAFNDKTKKGDLSELKDFGPRFVLAKVTEVREKGIATLAQVRSQVENSVRNEKKAEMLIKQINEVLQSNNTLEAVASRFSSSVNTAPNSYFTSYTIQGMGMEPNVTAAMTTLQVNQISKPIKGNNGVYVIQVTSINEPGANADRKAVISRLEQGYNSRAQYEVYDALNKMAKVVDKRSKFY